MVDSSDAQLHLSLFTCGSLLQCCTQNLKAAQYTPHLYMLLCMLHTANAAFFIFTDHDWLLDNALEQTLCICQEVASLRQHQLLPHTNQKLCAYCFCSSWSTADRSGKLGIAPGFPTHSELAAAAGTAGKACLLIKKAAIQQNSKTRIHRELAAASGIAGKACLLLQNSSIAAQDKSLCTASWQ